MSRKAYYGGSQYGGGSHLYRWRHAPLQNGVA